MKIIQSTWVRYHHLDLARELNKKGHLEKIFTALPWWKARVESETQNIPLEKISCNFLFQGVRRIARYSKISNHAIDSKLAEVETKFYSKWVEENIGDCDAYIGISGSGLLAGRKVKKQGGIYVMDRGSTHIRYADSVLNDEYLRLGLSPKKISPWLIENEEYEASEANIITVPSDFVKKTFISQGVDEEKIKVIPYGVDLREFFPENRNESIGFNLVFVGQASVRKGFLYLLDAFNLLNYKNKSLTVVGTVEKELIPLVRKRDTSKVEFVGIVPRNHVRIYMSKADALVLPSIEEGLALVQLQAMACGCPVIATPETGSETLFENEKHGFIIESRNINSLVYTFEKLIETPLIRKEMSIQCIRMSESNLFSWERYAGDMVREIELQINMGLKS